MMQGRVDAASRKGSLWQTVKAVAWSFLGIRRGSAFAEDAHRLTPFQIIAVGLAGGLLFVVGLMVLVKWIVAR